MKKTIFLLSLVASLALISCNSGASSEATSGADSTLVVVDSALVAADSSVVVADSTKADTAVKK